MCRWACGNTLRDHTRNDNTREIIKVENITERSRKARLKCLDTSRGKTKNTSEERLWRLYHVPGRRKRGRPKQIWMGCVNRDMRVIGTTTDEVHDITGWRRIVSAAA